MSLNVKIDAMLVEDEAGQGGALKPLVQMEIEGQKIVMDLATLERLGVMCLNHAFTAIADFNVYRGLRATQGEEAARQVLMLITEARNIPQEASRIIRPPLNPSYPFPFDPNGKPH